MPRSRSTIRSTSTPWCRRCSSCRRLAWDKLTPEDQAIFKQAAKDSVAKQRELWTAKVAESRAKVEAAGSQITTPDKQPFIDAMAPVYEKHVKDDKLKAMVEAIKAVQ